MKKLELKGETFGDLIVLEECRERKNKKVQWLCKCICGDERLVESYRLKNGSVTNCGCKNKTFTKRTLLKGSVYGSAEYNSWWGMKQRCENPKMKSYKYYGERGIKVCRRWVDSFDNFIDDMGNKPSSSHSIDRIDVDGDYTPENCRWATKAEQVRNRRQNKNNLSGYTGVRWDEYSKKWRASISVDGKNKHIGYYDEIENAFFARKKAEMKYWGCAL